MIEDDGKRMPMGCGCLLAFGIGMVTWALIAWALVVWVGKPEVREPRRVECERSTPPWAIAERCRR